MAFGIVLAVGISGSEQERISRECNPLRFDGRSETDVCNPRKLTASVDALADDRASDIEFTAYKNYLGKR